MLVLLLAGVVSPTSVPVAGSLTDSTADSGGGPGPSREDGLDLEEKVSGVVVVLQCLLCSSVVCVLLRVVARGVLRSSRRRVGVLSR